ncbi:UDP pyrophosphate phosphatase [Marinobacter confluentis]|uniref:UDP pyrophosphate phosphatase n=1 Tax=Marinobacter confluentis TaxID=1697557 RepID=A0A4Z1BXL1_9GAMM|nr:UDP pyrophosphate phosphatase [Marinobacter confluentis]TGN41989.1 UDP pyrophosphate phosphatase [Marinobacter confluentis]
MIGGVNPNSNLAYQTGNNVPVRERSDIARAPASTAEGNAGQVRRDLAEGASPSAESRPVTPQDALERRIEARRAAEDTRLERFRADDLPLNTSRALATFANVAAPASEAPDSLITGIDIRV